MWGLLALYFTELPLKAVRDLVGMGPSAFHQSEESMHALSKLFDDEGVSGETEGVISVTKSFVVQVFRKAPDGSYLERRRDGRSEDFGRKKREGRSEDFEDL